MKKIICLIAIAMLALTGCSVAKQPVIDRDTVLRHLYAHRKEMAAEVEYRKYNAIKKQEAKLSPEELQHLFKLYKEHVETK